MTVTGLLGQGSLSHINKPRLWSMFSIDKYVIADHVTLRDIIVQ